MASMLMGMIRCPFCISGLLLNHQGCPQATAFLDPARFSDTRKPGCATLTLLKWPDSGSDGYSPSLHREGSLTSPLVSSKLWDVS